MDNLWLVPIMALFTPNMFEGGSLTSEKMLKAMLTNNPEEKQRLMTEFVESLKEKCSEYLEKLQEEFMSSEFFEDLSLEDKQELLKAVEEKDWEKAQKIMEKLNVKKC